MAEEKRACTVFYAWQSDLPNKTNRTLIEEALQRAVDEIQKEGLVDSLVVIDRDVKGVRGSPDIGATILEKIDSAQVFVGDVSLVMSEKKRMKKGGEEKEVMRFTPNPNVLYELGYATSALGRNNIIMVFNEGYGDEKDLPFDLNRKLLAKYSLTDDGTAPGQARKHLVGLLKSKLVEIIRSLERDGPSVAASPAGRTAEAIRNQQPQQAARVKEFMAQLTADLEKIAPDWSREGEPDDLLAESIEATAAMVLEMARVAEEVAANRSREAAVEVYKGFGSVLERYNNPIGFSGSYHTYNFDLYRFAGHELFVSFVSPLVRDECWEILAEVLSESLYVPNVDGARPGVVAFEYISQPTVLLDHRSRRLSLQKACLQADILHERHTRGIIAGLVPAEQFMDADYFLFLRSVLQHDDPEQKLLWRAWSALYLQRRTPRFVVETQNLRYANRLIQALNVPDVETFKKRFREHRFLYGAFFPRAQGFYPFSTFDPLTIGTQ